MFYDYSNLISLDLSNFKTIKVTDMSFMFYGCSNLKVLNINQFIYNKNCNMKDILKGIDKIYCNLIVKEENIKKLFK